MKKALLACAVILVFAVTFGFVFTTPPAVGQAGDKHPRLNAAIVNLENAIDYMQKAPSTFDGHKANAIDACKKAVNQLKLAMAYDAKMDKKKK